MSTTTEVKSNTPYVTIQQLYVEPKVLHDGSSIEGDLDHGTGIGTRTFLDGHVWSGQLVSGFLNGEGTHTLPDGIVLKGTFANSKLHGRGTITYLDGTVDDGIFENGVLTFRKAEESKSKN
ncbi:MAG: hypothetical protein V4487_06995 [Chlamydiota bacterium]